MWACWLAFPVPGVTVRKESMRRRRARGKRQRRGRKRPSGGRVVALSDAYATTAAPSGSEVAEFSLVEARAAEVGGIRAVGTDQEKVVGAPLSPPLVASEADLQKVQRGTLGRGAGGMRSAFPFKQKKTKVLSSKDRSPAPTHDVYI